MPSNLRTALRWPISFRGIASTARRTFGLFLVLAVGFGCGDDDGTGPDANRNCTGDVTISVSAGLTPTFTWAPACRVAFFLVEADASDVWFIEPTGEQGIASGVTYGVVPAGARQEEPAIALESGVTYDVIVARGSGEDLVLAGIRSFTP
jgi:hypothetical protein